MKSEKSERHKAAPDAILVIKSLYPTLHKVEKRIADCILSDPENFINLTIAEIALKTDSAHSSIVRFCRIIGFEGFRQLKINIAKHLRKPEEAILCDIGRGDSPEEVLSKVYALAINTLEDTRDSVDRKAFAQAVNLLAEARRIEFYGVGTSATLALDAYYRFMRIGLPAHAAVDPHIARLSASMLDAHSVAVGISHTGRSKDTFHALGIAKRKGAKIVCITSFMKSPITDISDVRLVIVSPETKVMREAVSSRLAHVALLDSLYTAVALVNYGKSVSSIENMTGILRETRY